MNDITVRPVKISDIHILHRWGEENWELWGDGKYKWFTKDTLRKWIKDPEDDILLIASFGKISVGMCITSVMRDWAFCFGLFVEEAYRGQGIGKMLLAETGKQLKQRKVGSFSLLVDIKNDQAKKFYVREGFFEGYSFYLMTKEVA